MAPFDDDGNSGAADLDKPPVIGPPCISCAARSLTICAPLKEHDLGRIGDIAQTQSHSAQAVLFEEGDSADHLFNVTGGAIKLFRLLPDGRRQIMAFLYTGDFIGMSADDRYDYTAETITSSTLCRFPRRKLEDLMDESPTLQKRLFALAKTDLQAAQDRMVLLGRKTAQEKIASFLLDMSERAGSRGQPDNPVFVPMNRADIADFLGLTTETVSRTLTRFRGERLIESRDHSRIALVEIDRLREIAEGDS